MASLGEPRAVVLTRPGLAGELALGTGGRERVGLEGAWELRANVTAYDALYDAAARAQKATLVTADGPLSRTPGLGIIVHNVRVA